MIHLALAFLLFAPRPQTVSPSTQARTFLNDLAAGHYESAAAMSAAKMQAAAPASALESVWESLTQKYGAFKSFGATVVRGQAQGLEVTRTNVVFANSTIGVQIAVDSNGKIAGMFFVPPNPAPGVRLPAAEPVSGWRPPPYVQPAGFHEVNVTIGSAPWALPGFLTLPNGQGPFAAVVLIAGSGPEDADETIGPNKTFKDLAWGLASRGIAVLRYPKQTYYHRGRFAALSSFTVAQEYTEDAAAALSFLAGSPEIERDSIFVLGHSEGGMLAPRIAASPLAAGMISLAGPVQPMEDSVVMQMKYLASLQPPRVTAAQVKEAEADASAIESPSLRPGVWVPFAGTKLPAAYVLDLRHYNPARAAAALHKPVLVLQGGKDYQVTQVDYRLWKQGLAGDRLATFHYYPQLTHEFVAVSGPASPANYALPGHVAAQVVNDIAAWVHAQR